MTYPKKAWPALKTPYKKPLNSASFVPRQISTTSLSTELLSSISISDHIYFRKMSQMGRLKPGLTFVLGTMFGAFVASRRCHHHHHHDHGDRKPWSCPRQGRDKEIGSSTSSPGIMENTTTTPATTPSNPSMAN